MPATTGQRKRGPSRVVRPAARPVQSPPTRRIRWGRLLTVITAAIAMVVFTWWAVRGLSGNGTNTPSQTPNATVDAPLPGWQPMAKIPGGLFTMGYDFGPADARPAHDVELNDFGIDIYEVTNAQFARFIDATGYITTAEQIGRSTVFDFQAQRWLAINGANWRHPTGPLASIAGRESFPVVQVSWIDATTFARWAGKRLPTEAEWERAARGRLYDCDFPWGREEVVDKQYMANYWQGPFPFRDDAADGYREVCIVGSYAPNRLGLFDMSGNVAEWCADGYNENYYRLAPLNAPIGPEQSDRRVVRGGSWLSTDKTGAQHKVWSRASEPPRSANNHTGFRCARDLP